MKMHLFHTCDGQKSHDVVNAVHCKYWFGNVPMFVRKYMEHLVRTKNKNLVRTDEKKTCQVVRKDMEHLTTTSLKN